MAEEHSPGGTTRACKRASRATRTPVDTSGGRRRWHDDQHVKAGEQSHKTILQGVSIRRFLTWGIYEQHVKEGHRVTRTVSSWQRPARWYRGDLIQTVVVH